MTQIGARMHKKWSQSALFRPKWLPDGSQDPFRQEVSPAFINFWVPSGIQKSTENRSLAPKGAPESDFSSVFLAESVFVTFQLDFSAIISEKIMKKSMRVFKAARDFFNMALA